MPNHDRVPKIIDSRLVFEESIVKIQKETLLLSDQSTHAYYTLKTKPYAVVILATTEDGLYLFTEEYRYPTKKFLLSCPGGYLNENEDPIDAAKRELLEETGYEAETCELMGSAYPYAGFSSQKTLYVRAFNVRYKQSPALDATEVIQVTLKTKEELHQMIKTKTGELDGSLCTALFFDTQLY